PLDRSADGEHQGNAPRGGQRLGLAETIALHPEADVDEVVRAWYLAEADAYVRPFTEPNPHTLPAGDAIPAALELWEPGDEFTDLDWPGTLAASPIIVPGVTTRRRTFIEDERREP